MTADQKKKPSAGFWITVTLVVALVAYPLSFGPACWISSHLNAGTRAVTVVYRPITWGLSDNYNCPLDNAIRWYARLGAAHESWGWFKIFDNWEWFMLSEV